jgi:hypothetical protein
MNRILRALYNNYLWGGMDAQKQLVHYPTVNLYWDMKLTAHSSL